MKKLFLALPLSMLLLPAAAGAQTPYPSTQVVPGYVAVPEEGLLPRSIHELEHLREQLSAGPPDRDGHRDRALADINAALAELHHLDWEIRRY